MTTLWTDSLVMIKSSLYLLIYLSIPSLFLNFSKTLPEGCPILFKTNWISLIECLPGSSC